MTSEHKPHSELVETVRDYMDGTKIDREEGLFHLARLEEQLEASRERYDELKIAKNEQRDELQEQLETLELENARLKNALRRIADAPGKNATVTGGVARAALVSNSSSGAPSTVGSMGAPGVSSPASESGENSATEFVWLIERGQPENQEPTVWLDITEERPGWYGVWTTDPYKAARFGDRIGAETHITKLNIRHARAVEHGFMRDACPASTPDVSERLGVEAQGLLTSGNPSVGTSRSETSDPAKERLR